MNKETSFISLKLLSYYTKVLIYILSLFLSPDVVIS